MNKATRQRAYQAGVIDVGAHSIRLDLFEVSAGGITLLESLSRSVNLGYDVFRHGMVSPENLALIGGIMADFAGKLAEYKVKCYRVCATSAIREAFNRELVINRIRNVSGLSIEILETQEEVRITYLAMREALRKTMNFKELTGLCLVVGTGSLLVSWFDKGLMRFSEAVPLGTVRLIDAYGRSQVPVGQVLETLRSQDIRQRLLESVGQDAERPVTLVAMGASVRALAGVSGENDEALLEIDCASMRERVRRAMAGQLPDGARDSDTRRISNAACGAILNYFLEEFDCQGFLCPAVTTRSALIEDLVRGRGGRGRGRQSDDPFHDDLLAVCGAIGHKYGYDPDHAHQVCDISRKLLDKLKRHFDFTPRARILLEVAAHLHDIGRFVDTRGHNKHSCYLIMHMQLPGISATEQQVIAAMARYHRKSGPKESHDEYMVLGAEDKVTVLKLAAILRVADALDCSRRRRFRKLKLAMRGHTLVLQAPMAGDFHSERFYLEQKGGLFNQVFGLELKLEETPEGG